MGCSPSGNPNNKGASSKLPHSPKHNSEWYLNKQEETKKIFEEKKKSLEEEYEEKVKQFQEREKDLKENLRQLEEKFEQEKLLRLKGQFEKDLVAAEVKKLEMKLQEEEAQLKKEINNKEQMKLEYEKKLAESNGGIGKKLVKDAAGAAYDFVAGGIGRVIEGVVGK